MFRASGFRVQGLGFQGFRFRVWGSLISPFLGLEGSASLQGLGVQAFLA